MSTIREMFERFTDVNADMVSIVNDIATELTPKIVEYNKKQLAEGKTSEDKKIGDKSPYFKTDYFPNHEAHRINKGLRVDLIDLKWSGKLYDSLFPEFDFTKYKILSNDNPSKVNALMYGGTGGDRTCGCLSVREGGFGEEIFGLTQTNATEIQKSGNNLLVKEIKIRTKL